MSRALSSAAIASLNAQETGEVWLVLITLSHADLGTPIRVVNNNEDIISRGQTYKAFPFEFVLPNTDGDSPSKATLRIDNIDRQIVTTLRTLSSGPSITMEVIMASAPNTVEISLAGMKLANATYDINIVDGEIIAEPLFNEPITAQMTPSRFPGMF